MELTTIAKALIAKNAGLKTAATQDKGYQAVAAMLSGRVMAAIGQKSGSYINKHDLIWALINEAQGNTSDLDLSGF